MVEFRKSARTEGEWIWIHDGSPVYEVNSGTWTKTTDKDVSPGATVIWNPFDGEIGTQSGGRLTALGSISNDYITGTLDGDSTVNVMYFKYGRTQEGRWSHDETDDSFVDFSTARIGCWVSEQKSFTIAAGLTELTFNNVNLQGRYPRTGFVSIEGIKLDSGDIMDWKLGDMTVYEDSSGDDDVRVILTPGATAGIAVDVEFGSKLVLEELLGIDAGDLTHFTVYAYPRDTDSDDGFGDGIRHATNAPAIAATDTEETFTTAFTPALTSGVEYEIRLRGGTGQTESDNTGNEVVVGIATAGADHPIFTRVYNMSTGVKVFGVKWAITDDGGSAFIDADGNTLKARAVVFG